MPSSPTVPMKVGLAAADMRAESSFLASIAPAGNDKFVIGYLIVKNQIFFPLAQGFLWALVKDWLVLLGAAARASGALRGQQMRHWLHEWLKVSPAGSGAVEHYKS